MEPKVTKDEVAYVTHMISTYAQNYSPKILFVLVNKRITHRLFVQNNGNYINPGPGTVLDHTLVN